MNHPQITQNSFERNAMIVRPRHFLLIALIGLLSVTAIAQDTMDGFKDFDFSKTSLKQTQVQKLAMEDLKLLRGIVFGRHGRVFKDGEIKSYLEEQSWYKPNPDFKH